jgi:hypothetical protein
MVRLNASIDVLDRRRIMMASVPAARGRHRAFCGAAVPVPDTELEFIVRCSPCAFFTPASALQKSNRVDNKRELLLCTRQPLRRKRAGDKPVTIFVSLFLPIGDSVSRVMRPLPAMIVPCSL